MSRFTRSLSRAPSRGREAAKRYGSRGGAAARRDVAAGTVARRRDPHPIRLAQDETPPREQILPAARRAFAASRAQTLLLPLVLTACAQQVGSAVAPAAPGFLLGLWHGFIFPVAWVLSLFVPDIAVYAVPNNGGWYDFGYFLGIVVFGVGARKSKTVYVSRRRG